MNWLPPQTCYLLFGFKLPFYFHYFLLALIFYKPLTFLIKNRYFRWFIIFLLPTIILVQLLRNGFFFQSDDFAHLKISAEWSFWDIFSKGMGKEAIWGFHHIFTGFWLFKAIFLLFGVKFEPYLFFNFLLHLVNLSLFYLILNKTKKSSVVFSVLVTFLFGTFYLSWISNVHELVAATFLLLGIFFWLDWLALGKKSYLYLILVFYLLSMFSKEITFVLPAILVLISIVYNFYVARVSLKRVLLATVPFFFISAFHFLIYGRVYFEFFHLGGGDGYSAKFSVLVFLKNLLVYLTRVIPILNSSIFGFLIFLLTMVSFDFWKRKLLLLPLFLSYLILIAPAALFERKIALYYAYIPSIFLYLLFFIFFGEIYLSLNKLLKKRKLLLKIFNIYFVLVIALGIFRLDKFFLDNCFLIHYPWENPHRIALNSITAKMDRLFSQGEIKEGREIKLEEREATHEMKYLFSTNALYLFLQDAKAINYTLVFDEDRNSLLVQEVSSHRKISF